MTSKANHSMGYSRAPRVLLGSALLMASSLVLAAESVVYVNGQTIAAAASSVYMTAANDMTAIGAEDNNWTSDCTTATGGCDGRVRASLLTFSTPRYTCNDLALKSVIVEYRYKIDFKSVDSIEGFTVQLPNQNQQVIKLWASGTAAPPAVGPTAETFALTPVPTRADLAAAQWNIANDGEIKFDYIRLRIDDGCPPILAPAPVPGAPWWLLAPGVLLMAGAGVRWRARSRRRGS